MDKHELYELHKELEAAHNLLQHHLDRIRVISDGGDDDYEWGYSDGVRFAYDELDESALLEDLNDLLKKVSNAMNRHEYKYIPPSPGQLELWKLEDEQECRESSDS